MSKRKCIQFHLENNKISFKLQKQATMEENTVVVFVIYVYK